MTPYEFGQFLKLSADAATYQRVFGMSPAAAQARAQRSQGLKATGQQVQQAAGAPNATGTFEQGKLTQAQPQLPAKVIAPKLVPPKPAQPAKPAIPKRTVTSDAAADFF